VVDKAKLDHLLSSLQRYVGVLRMLAAVPRTELLANPDKIGNAKYHFVIAIECAIDIANHVIASENYRFPKDNADAFAVLVDSGILGPERKEALQSMARFRNRLVHMYWEVDDARVHEYLTSSLADFEYYAAAIAGRW
jgi:uncharacterized protein YutE (UPF0331/DUF86 family)